MRINTVYTIGIDENKHILFLNILGNFLISESRLSRRINAGQDSFGMLVCVYRNR